MIQTQILDKDVFDDLKQYATYSSELTGVLELPDKFRGKIPTEYKIFQKLDDDKISVDWDGKSSFVVNGTIEDSLRIYLGMFNPYVRTVSIKDIRKIYALLNHGIIEEGQSFANYFYPLGEDARIGDLVYADKKRNCSGKKIDLSPYANIKLKKVFSGTKMEIDTKYYSKECVVRSATQSRNGKGVSYTSILLQYGTRTSTVDVLANIYGLQTPMLKSIKAGDKFNCLVHRKDDGSTVLEEFLPNGMSCNKVIYKPSDEFKKTVKVPIEAFRIMYYEWLLRTL